LVGKKTFEEKMEHYSDAIASVLKKLSAELDAKTVVAGNIFSPSFEDGLHQGLVKHAQRKIGDTLVYSPLIGKSLNHVTQLFTRMKPSMGLPTYPFSRVGLVSQCIGLVTEEKMDVIKAADKTVEETLGGFVPGRYFFTAVADNIKTRPKDRSLLESIVYNSFRNLNTVFTDIGESVDLVPSMTGWGRFLLINVKDDSGEQFMPNNSTLLTLQEKILSASKQTRVGYCISSGNTEGKYLIVLRYFESTDFNVAIPSSQNWNRLLGVGRKIVQSNDEVAGCYIDLSTKPPAKIGYL
jgi:GMP synthase PP-ATPase subunit